VRILVLLNTNAGGRDRIESLREYLHGKQWTVREPADADAFETELKRATAEGFDRLVVAGGDGTVHRAVNVLAAVPGAPPLGIIPLGTGNDFARTLDLPLDPLAAADAIETGHVRSLDAIEVSGDATLTMINAATGGFAGQVTTNLTDERKQSWGPLAYVREAADLAADPPRWSVTVRLDGGRERTYEAFNVVVANGRTSAGGIPIAPKASPEDGRLDVLIVKATEALDRAVIASRILAGDYDREDAVVSRRAKRVEIRCDPAMPFSLDGEEREGRHFRFRVRPRAVAFVVGPGYRGHVRRYRAGVLGLAAGVFGGFARLLRAAPTAAPVAVLSLLIGCLLFAGIVAKRHDFAETNAAVLNGVFTYRTDAGTRLAIGLTRLGSSPAVVLIVCGIAAALAARRRFLDASILAVIVFGAMISNALLKLVFTDLRPELAPSPDPAEGYSFPSGHAAAAVALYGTLAALVPRGTPRWRWLAVGACLVTAVCIMASRLVLGVHWPTDVAAGALVGGVWLAGGLAVRSVARRRAAATG
jgi:diacylglycerol kinase (ATP)